MTTKITLNATNKWTKISKRKKSTTPTLMDSVSVYFFEIVNYKKKNHKNEKNNNNNKQENLKLPY